MNFIQRRFFIELILEILTLTQSWNRLSYPQDSFRENGKVVKRLKRRSNVFIFLWWIDLRCIISYLSLHDFFSVGSREMKQWDFCMKRLPHITVTFSQPHQKYFETRFLPHQATWDYNSSRLCVQHVLISRQNGPNRNFSQFRNYIIRQFAHMKTRCHKNFSDKCKQEWAAPLLFCNLTDPVRIFNAEIINHDWALEKIGNRQNLLLRHGIFQKVESYYSLIFIHKVLLLQIISFFALRFNL